MKLSDWETRWREGRTGFHLGTVHPWLVEHEQELGLPTAGARVLVPLCGKSHDLLWLAQRGHEVHGVEAVPQAVEEFHAEHGLEPVRRATAMGERFESVVTIHRADFFELDLAALGPFDAVWDRAALIALPPQVRPRYAERLLGALRPAGRMLVVGLETFPERPGPPFTVAAGELRTLFRDHAPTLLRREEVLDQNPRFRDDGVQRMEESLWRVERDAGPVPPRPC